MAPNAFISNGTCYYAAGKKAATAFLPCGNDALGHKTCCQAGDMCLSSRACYNGQYGVTYLSGCSDSAYAHQSCPDKQAFKDTPWTGLVLCNGTNQWLQCDQAGKQATLAEPDTCSCPSTSRTVAFTDATRLTNVVQLPTAAGQSVIWQPGFVPTSTATTTSSKPTSSSSPSRSTTTHSSTSQTSISTTASSTSSITPVATPSDLPQEDTGGLSVGAKSGIGVGVGIAGLAMIGALLLFLYRRRRRDRPETPTEPGSAMKTGSPATVAASELESQAARPWSLRSELQGHTTPGSIAGYLDEHNAGPKQAPTWQPDSQYKHAAELQG